MLCRSPLWVLACRVQPLGDMRRGADEGVSCVHVCAQGGVHRWRRHPSCWEKEIHQNNPPLLPSVILLPSSIRQLIRDGKPTFLSHNRECATPPTLTHHPSCHWEGVRAMTVRRNEGIERWRRGRSGVVYRSRKTSTIQSRSWDWFDPIDFTHILPISHLYVCQRKKKRRTVIGGDHNDFFF